eukprot:5451402-Amphidinium_carterae.1
MPCFLDALVLRFEEMGSRLKGKVWPKKPVTWSLHAEDSKVRFVCGTEEAVLKVCLPEPAPED